MVHAESPIRSFCPVLDFVHAVISVVHPRQEMMRRHFGILRTTALGGVLFLLPLIVVGALIGEAVPIVIAVAEFLGRFIPTRDVAGVSLLVLVAIAICLGICFAAGVVARLSLGKRLSGWVERNVLLVFPRYAIVRDQMAGTVGGGIVESTLKPVLVRFDDHEALAFESDRNTDVGGRVVIYLPGAPDPWTGQVIFVDCSRVTPLTIDFGAAIDICKRLGRESSAALRKAM